MVRDDPFLGGKYCIHIASVEEAETVYDHYEKVWGIEKSRNSSTVDNCMYYPYLIMSGAFGHIGGNGSKYDHDCMEFPEWGAFVGLDLKDNFGDIDMSDISIADLLEV